MLNNHIKKYIHIHKIRTSTQKDEKRNLIQETNLAICKNSNMYTYT